MGAVHFKTGLDFRRLRVIGNKQPSRLPIQPRRPPPLPVCGVYAHARWIWSLFLLLFCGVVLDVPATTSTLSTCALEMTALVRVMHVSYSLPPSLNMNGPDPWQQKHGAQLFGSCGGQTPPRLGRPHRHGGGRQRLAHCFQQEPRLRHERLH